MAKQKVRRLTITPAKNGYSVECDYENSNKEPFNYSPSKPAVFTNMKEMLDHIEDELEGTAEGSKEEKAEGEVSKPKIRVLGVRMIRRDKARKA